MYYPHGNRETLWASQSYRNRKQGGDGCTVLIFNKVGIEGQGLLGIHAPSAK